MVSLRRKLKKRGNVANPKCHRWVFKIFKILSVKFATSVSLAVAITALILTSLVSVPRRKLKADISAALPSLTADELSELVPNKEELSVVKIYAHKGDAVTLYVLNKNPLFFELEKQLYPTGETLAV